MPTARLRTVAIVVTLAALASCGGGKKGDARCAGGACNRPVLPRELMYGFLDDGSVEDADLILQDRWPIPRYQPVQLPPPSQLTWTEDPYQEKYWRFIFYSMRGTAPLLAAWRSTGDARYRDKLMDFIQAFAERGQSSAFSADKHSTAFRAMVLTNTWGKLDAVHALSDSERQMLHGLIEATANFLADPDHFDPDYNHGINEANALLLVSENFPDMANAATWGATARQRLESLMHTAVGSDGVANEMSPYYHFYIVDALWQTLKWSRDNGIAGTPDLEPTLRGMVRYATVIMQPDGNVPLVAACLERQVRRYDPAVFDDVRASDANFDYVMSAGATGTAPNARLALFPAAGHAILRSDFDAAKFAEQTHVFFDLSPYRTAQSQHDALNVVVYGAGRTLLTDSGLFTYVAGADRDYFIGTRAHNTVVVDGLDQKEGPVVPGLSRSTAGWLYQSGYHQLYDDVTHRRGVLLLQRDLVLVVDRLQGTLPHRFEQTWHVQPDIDLTIDATGSALARDAKSPILAIRQGLATGAPALVKGSVAPVDGWYSAQYQVKQPSGSLKFPQVATSADYVTLLASGRFAVEGASVRASASAGRLEATICARGVSYHVAITNLASPGEDVAVDSAGACP